MKNLIIPIVFILILSGCDNRTFFKEYNSFDDVSWNRHDIMEFEVPVEKNTMNDFYLALRHHTNFPYTFIDVNITLYTPDGEMRSRDYHYRLIGTDLKWKGDGMGELWDVELPIRKGISFKKSGICKIRVENKMKKMETPGIIEIGILAKESEEN